MGNRDAHIVIKGRQGKIHFADGTKTPDLGSRALLRKAISEANGAQKKDGKKISRQAGMAILAAIQKSDIPEDIPENRPSRKERKRLKEEARYVPHITVLA